MERIHELPFIKTKPIYTTALRKAKKISGLGIEILETVLLFWKPNEGAIDVSVGTLQQNTGASRRFIQKELSVARKQFPGYVVEIDGKLMFDPSVVLGKGETGHLYGKLGEDLDIQYPTKGFLRKSPAINALYRTLGLKRTEIELIEYLQWHRRDEAPNSLPYPSFKSIQKDLGFSRNNAARAFLGLCKAGLLKRISGTRTTSTQYDVRPCIQRLNEIAKKVFQVSVQQKSNTKSSTGRTKEEVEEQLKWAFNNKNMYAVEMWQKELQEFESPKILLTGS